MAKHVRFCHQVEQKLANFGVSFLDFDVYVRLGGLDDTKNLSKGRDLFPVNSYRLHLLKGQVLKVLMVEFRAFLLEEAFESAMNDDDFLVRSEPDVKFDAVKAGIDGLLEGFEGVFGFKTPAVAFYLEFGEVLGELLLVNS